MIVLLIASIVSIIMGLTIESQREEQGYIDGLGLIASVIIVVVNMILFTIMLLTDMQSLVGVHVKIVNLNTKTRTLTLFGVIC